MQNNNNSNVNTILIVLLLILVTGAIVWFFSGKKAEEAPSTNAIDVTIPVPDLGDKEEGNNP